MVVFPLSRRAESQERDRDRSIALFASSLYSLSLAFLSFIFFPSFCLSFFLSARTCSRGKVCCPVYAGGSTFEKHDHYNGSLLHFHRVERRQMGAYLCIASNDVPPAVSKRVTLAVNCKPDSLTRYYPTGRSDPPIILSESSTARLRRGETNGRGNDRRMVRAKLSDAPLEEAGKCARRKETINLL